MKKNYYFLFVAFFYLITSGYLSANENFLRIYPKKRSFHKSEKIVFSIFNRGSNKVELKFIPLSEEIYSKAIGNIWSSSYQKKLQGFSNIAARSAWSRVINVNDGANYISIHPDRISGYYLVTAQGNNGTFSSTPVMVSDIGIITKLSKKRLAVFAVHMEKGFPIPGAKITIEGSNLKKSAYTNRNGYLSILLDSKNRDYLKIKAQSKLFGRAFTYAKSSPYQDSRYYAYIATNKPVYKNNHTVKWYGIIRYYQNGRFIPLKNKILEYEIYNPQKKKIHSGKVKTDSYGKVSAAYPLSVKLSGIFHIKLNINNERHQGDFLVKDYIKPRLSVNVQTENRQYLYYENIRATISAKYIYGDIPENANVEYTVYKGSYSPPAFDIREEERFFDILSPAPSTSGDIVTTGKGVLDANGELSFIIPKTEEQKNMIYTISAKVQAKAENNIIDSGSGKASVKVFASSIILQSKKKYALLRSGQKEYLKARVTGIASNPVAGKKIQVKIYREIWDEHSGYHHERAKIEYILTKEFTEKTDRQGMALIQFSMRKAGRYQVTLSSKDFRGNIVFSRQYYWVLSEEESLNSASLFDMNIESDKTFYQNNETATLLFSSSRKNIYLFYTIEGDDIYKIDYTDIENNFLKIPLRLNDQAYLPNIYVHAFYVKNGKLTEGILPIYISPRDKFISISLQPERNIYKPKEEVTVKVTTRDIHSRPVPSSVTVSVVDESVFMVSPQLAPGIKKFFYGKKPNRVSTTYSFPDIFTGGDSKSPSNDEDLRFRFNDTAYFNNSVLTDKNGNGSFTFRLPDNITSWRISTTAVDQKDAVGFQKTNIIARKDLMLSARMPRYLNAASRAEIVSVIKNRTKEPMRVRAGIKASNLLLLDNSRERILTIPGQSSQTITYQIKAAKTISSGENAALYFYAKSLDNKYADSIKKLLPVYENGIDHTISSKPLWILHNNKQSKRHLISINESVSKELSRNTRYHIKSGEIIIIPNLVANTFHNLEYLIEYPHGCTEQTTSKLLASLRVNGFLNRYSINNPSLKKKLDHNIKAGIKRLLEMHNEKRGAWGWWQSRDSYAVNHWMSAYAMYGLSIAKNQGYLVDEKRFKASVMSLEKFILNTGSERKDSLDEHDYPQKESFAAFATYVLSLTSNADPSNLDVIMTLKEKLKNETLSWAIMAYRQMNEKKKAAILAKVLIDRKKSDIYNNYSTQSSNTSIIFQRALTFTGILPDDSPEAIKEQNGDLLFMLNRQQYNGKTRSTRETFAQLNATILFLEKYHKYIKSNMDVEISLNQWKKKLKAKDQTNPIRIDVPKNIIASDLTRPLSIQTSGDGLTGIYFIAKVFEKTEKFTPINKGIKVSRSYYHNDGTPFKGRVYQGETLDVIVTLNIQRDHRNYLMALEHIPAGFVLESEYDSSYGRTNVQIEKDRIYFYLENYSLKPMFRYRIRAVNKGVYLVPPVKAEFMYFDEIYGTSSSEVIHVD